MASRARRESCVPIAVRLALAAPPIERLEEGLRTLAGMLHASEQDFALVE